jgi:diadenosine tetraphosphate (Ap4A) HIT family hydrolase
MAKKKKFVDIEAAGDRTDYAEVLKRIEKDKVCPFCPENFKYHTRPILRKGKFWFATENFAPYTGTRHHFIFVFTSHIEHVEEISPKAWQELLAQFKWITKKYKIQGGSLFMRFGDKRFTGASVTQHIHAQLITGAPKGKDTFEIRPGLGFGKNK